mgnify:FL=1
MNEGKDYRAQFLWLHGVDYDRQRYWEQFSYGRPTEPNDEILVVVGPNGRAKWEPWGGPGVAPSGYIATNGFRRPIPRPTDRLLDAMACGWDRSGQAVVWKHPFCEEQTFDRKEATNYLNRCEKDCEAARYFPMEFARKVSEIYADKSRDDTELLPIKQRKEQPTATSCFRACVATVLGFEVDQVPRCCDGDAWDWDAFQNWLACFNLQALELLLGDSPILYPIPRRATVIITGPSPRPCSSGRHAVVGKCVGLTGFEYLHDPHPSGEFLAGDPTHLIFFVLLNTARTIQLMARADLSANWKQGVQRMAEKRELTDTPTPRETHD